METGLTLDRMTRLPDNLGHLQPREIKQAFARPTLIHLAGDRAEPLFVSTLLHGNETSSFRVLQYLQKTYARRPPPRSLLILVGNVDATAAGERFLDGQPDFNRIWAHGTTPWHKLAQQVLDAAREAEVFASIDIHNNTGANPLYGCVNALRPADLHLAALFAPIGVFYRNPATTQSIAFSALCPAVTIECGQPDTEPGINAAIDLVDAALRIDRFPDHPPPDDKLTIFETVGRVLVRPGTSFAFGGDAKDLVFAPDLETLNFTPLPAGTVWARTARDSALHVVDEHGADLTHEFFRRDGKSLILTRDVVPAMITQDRDVIAKDCLCYFMEAR